MSRPGNFLRFLLVEEEMLVDTAASQTGLTTQQIGEVIAGTLPVTPEVAEKLAKLAGTTPQLWLKLQAEQ